MYKIALIVNNFDVGGLENVVLSLLTHLNSADFEVFVLCLNGRGAQFNRIGIDPANCLILQKKGIHIGPLSVDLSAVRQIRHFIFEHKIQLVHAHNAAPLIYTGMSRIGMRHKPVLLYTEHNQIYSASPFSKFKFKYYVKFADHIVAISNNLKNELQVKFNAGCPMSLIYNGVDGSKFTQSCPADIRKEFSISDDMLIFGCGVVLTQQKGLEYLFTAISMIKDRLARCLFLIAGDGPLRDTLASQVEDLGITAYVKFIGQRSDMPAVIQALDVYVLPSLWEGLPLALIEALAMGKPIICTAVGGNPEIVIDQVNGIVVPPQDPEALAAAMIELLESPKLQKKLAVNNRKRFENLFSEAAMVSGHENLYKSLLN